MGYGLDTLQLIEKTLTKVSLFFELLVDDIERNIMAFDKSKHLIDVKVVCFYLIVDIC